MSLISVIVPVYNGEATIRETIESVLQQTLTNFEVIIIDDGSSDRTVEIVSEIADPRTKLFSYSNAGQGASRNRGVEQSRGDYLAFLDADDLWTPDKLEAQLNALQTHPNAAVAYSWVDFIDESGNFLHSGSHLSITGNAYAHLLLSNLLENGSNPLIQTHAFLDIGGFDPSLPPTEDWDLYLRLAEKYEFAVVPRPQILYRVSATTASSRVLKLEQQCRQVIEAAFARSPNSLQYLKRYSLSNLYKYLLYKAIENPQGRTNGLAAIKFWSYAVANDLGFLRHKRIVVAALLKGLTISIFPFPIARRLLKQLEIISDSKRIFVNFRACP